MLKTELYKKEENVIQTYPRPLTAEETRIRADVVRKRDSLAMYRVRGEP